MSNKIYEGVFVPDTELYAAQLDTLIDNLNNHKHSGGANDGETIYYVGSAGDQTITGIKTFSSAPVFSSGISLSNQQALGLCVENRTDDSGCTQTGRLWFRIDV